MNMKFSKKVLIGRGENGLVRLENLRKLADNLFGGDFSLIGRARTGQRRLNCDRDPKKGLYPRRNQQTEGGKAGKSPKTCPGKVSWEFHRDDGSRLGESL
jgi:hypothetical protein